MPDSICPQCGQKALSVATRCPRCGHAFAARVFQHSARRRKPQRFSIGVLVAGVALTLLAANYLRERFGLAPPAPAPVKVPVAAQPVRPEPPPPRPAPRVVPESVVAAPPEVWPSREPVASRVSLQPEPVTPVVMPPPVETAGRHRRYAAMWMNVRADRSSSAAVLRILRPGELVQVDMLVQGWYRVVSAGEQPGWADRRLLDTLPPAPR